MTMTDGAPGPPRGPLTILVCALGGEGGGVLAEWLYAAAVRAGHAAQATSIPGVAQRTGATTYYIEIDRRPGSAERDDATVFSLNPVPGALDVLVSSELLETARQVLAGFASPQRTLVLSATGRALTVAEKMVPGDGRLDDAALRAAVQQQARATDWLDLQGMARSAGTAISAPMFGALSGSGVLPWPRSTSEETIRAGGKGVEASLKGFAAACEAAAALRAQREQANAWLAAAAAPAAGPKPPTDWTRLGRARVKSYQDEDYARLYDARLARIATAEARAAGGPAEASRSIHGATADETARWLALWMCFDDIVRVAAAKLAATRVERVRRDVAARDDEVVRIYDHFKPGVPEFAGLLPPALARRLQRWDGRRTAAGREPWAFPIRLGSHTLHGALLLRLLAGAKGLRRRGQRWADEQQRIEHWLAAVERGCREHPGLGLALARAGALVKGYGATHGRSQAQLAHLIDHLAFDPAGAPPTDPADRAAAVERALAAAQADHAGQALASVLRERGAPSQVMVESPVRFYRRRPA